MVIRVDITSVLNRLPRMVVESPSPEIHVFKACLDTYLGNLL